MTTKSPGKYTLRLASNEGIVGTADTVHGVVGLASALPDFVREQCDVYVVSPLGRRMSIAEAIEESEIDDDADTLQDAETTRAILEGNAA